MLWFSSGPRICKNGGSAPFEKYRLDPRRPAGGSSDLGPNLTFVPAAPKTAGPDGEILHNLPPLPMRSIVYRPCLRKPYDASYQPSAPQLFHVSLLLHPCFIPDETP
ncbi:MAG: hypothetical protein AB7J13_02280 [Pyrinomonadaceae bacterium]